MNRQSTTIKNHWPYQPSASILLPFLTPLWTTNTSLVPTKCHFPAKTSLPAALTADHDSCITATNMRPVMDTDQLLVITWGVRASRCIGSRSVVKLRCQIGGQATRTHPRQGESSLAARFDLADKRFDHSTCKNAVFVFLGFPGS